MDWQQIISLCIVGCTVGLMAWSYIRKRRRALGCCDGCPYISREAFRNAAAQARAAQQATGDRRVNVTTERIVS